MPRSHVQQAWRNSTRVCILRSESAPAQDSNFRSVEDRSLLDGPPCLLHIIFNIVDWFLRAFSSFPAYLHVVVTNHWPATNEKASFTKLPSYRLLFVFLWNFREKAVLKCLQKNPQEATDSGWREGTADRGFRFLLKYVSMIHNNALVPTCDWSKFANSLL